jgi:hypothetical protein
MTQMLNSPIGEMWNEATVSSTRPNDDDASTKFEIFYTIFVLCERVTNCRSISGSLFSPRSRSACNQTRIQAQPSFLLSVRAWSSEPCHLMSDDTATWHMRRACVRAWRYGLRHPL